MCKHNHTVNTQHKPIHETFNFLTHWVSFFLKSSLQALMLEILPPPSSHRSQICVTLRQIGCDPKPARGWPRSQTRAKTSRPPPAPHSNSQSPFSLSLLWATTVGRARGRDVWGSRGWGASVGEERLSFDENVIENCFDFTCRKVSWIRHKEDEKDKLREKQFK